MCDCMHCHRDYTGISFTCKSPEKSFKEKGDNMKKNRSNLQQLIVKILITSR